MKAIVEATGEVVEVNECGQTFKDMGWDYMDMRGRCYKSEDLDFTDNTPFDYWTRLEHQVAIAAMGGICGNTSYNESTWESMAEDAILAAHFFVQKLKEKEEKK